MSQCPNLIEPMYTNYSHTPPRLRLVTAAVADIHQAASGYQPGCSAVAVGLALPRAEHTADIVEAATGRSLAAVAAVAAVAGSTVPVIADSGRMLD
jgi:hypothetical protein